MSKPLVVSIPHHLGKAVQLFEERPKAIAPCASELFLDPCADVRFDAVVVEERVVNVQQEDDVSRLGPHHGEVRVAACDVIKRGGRLPAGPRTTAP